MEYPTPRECPAIVGVVLGVLAGLIGLWMIVFADVRPWGFVTLAVSGWVSFTSVIVCLAWEWEHFTP